MERLWAELDDADGDASFFVGAFEVPLGYHLVVSHDEEGMHVRYLASTQTPLERIKSNAIRTI